MCLLWGEDRVWPHRHKAQIECCSDVCPSVGFSYLHIWSKDQSQSVAQFGQEASSRRSPGCFKLLPLRVTNMLLWAFNAAEILLNSSPDVWLGAMLFLSSTGSLFDLRAWFLLYAFSAVRPFIKTCVPFQIIPIQLNLPQVKLHSKCSNIYKWYECSWAKFQLSKIRLWILVQWNRFIFLFLINLQRC